MTDHSHTRNTGVEHVHGHVTAIDGIIVTDPAIEVGHVTEADHATEAGRVTGSVTVAVVTGINTTVAAEAGVVTVTVIGESVTVCVTVTARIGKGFLLRL